MTDISDMYNDELKANPSDAVVDDIMWKIKSVNKDIDTLNVRKAESMEFYDAKIDKKKEELSKLIGVIENYIRNIIDGRKTIEVPNGVMRLRTTRKIDWNKATEEELIGFSLENEIDLKETIKPIKKAISSYIKSTGDAPDWFEEVEETKFSYQLNKSEAEND